MKKNEIYLTQNKYDELEKELHELKFTKRDQIIIDLQEARAQGDLSENADYAAAREEQSLNEGRIKELEAVLESAVIIEENIHHDVAEIGSTVIIYDVTTKERASYRIVGSQETNPDEGKISNNSPIAQALIGKKIGDTVTVNAPMGEYQLVIESIE